MKKSGACKKTNHRKLVSGAMAVVLLFGGSMVWAGKNDTEIQLKKDKPAQQGKTAPKPQQKPDPLRDLYNLQWEMDRLFGNALNPYIGFPEFDAVLDQDLKQAMDLRELPDAFVVQMDLPGLQKSDITIEVKDRVLSVSGKREQSMKKKEGEKIIMQERSLNAFSREVVLSKSVDADKVVAEYKDGVLTISLPKTETDQATRKIEIK